MKKIFTAMFAMAAVFCASAAVPTYTVSPEEGTIQNREDLKTVTFTFSEAVTVPTARCVGGERFNSVFTDVELNMTAPSTKVEVIVPSTAWGEPTGGQYLLSVNLPAIYDSKGDQIMVTFTDEETGETWEDAYTVSAAYTSPDNTPASYVGVDPDPAYTTAWDAYLDGWGFVDFGFTAAVDLSGKDAGATVRFIIDGDIINETISVDDIWMDWNMWTGTYSVSVPIPYIEDLEEEDLESIRVTLKGVQSNGKDIDVPAVTYTATVNQNTKKAPGTASISISTTATSYNVYNINGNVVMENATKCELKTLSKGLYIINGVKTVIR